MTACMIHVPITPASTGFRNGFSNIPVGLVHVKSLMTHTLPFV